MLDARFRIGNTGAGRNGINGTASQHQGGPVHLLGGHFGDGSVRVLRRAATSGLEVSVGSFGVTPPALRRFSSLYAYTPFARNFVLQPGRHNLMVLR